MNRHDREAHQPANMSQRPLWGRRGASLAILAWLAAPIGIEILFGSYLPRSPQGRLAYGGASFALAVVAILLIPVISKAPVAPARYVLAGVALLLITPSVWGSVVVVAALFAVAGYHVAIFVAVIMGLCLWALLFLPLASFTRRVAARA